MQELKNSLPISSFSHIYMEREIKNHPNTQKIISRFRNAFLIEIDHYKEVFCRGHQSFTLQKQTPKLILAKKKDAFVYQGAEVCEDFGNDRFYYTSSMMNCIYDCEYCYLQGMYPSANIVIFVNLEDVFEEVERLLMEGPIYLCISYDTDLLAFEGITSFVALWTEFARRHPSLKLELRTKSANFKAIENIPPLENFILAWTLSPSPVASRYETNAPSLEARLQSARKAMEKGWKVRICFDPLLYIKDWRVYYSRCIEETFRVLPSDKIYDISIEVFRMAKDYLKKIQRERPHSVLLAYPFVCDDGVFSYAEKHTKEMVDFVYKKIRAYLPKEKIYR